MRHLTFVLALTPTMAFAQTAEEIAALVAQFQQESLDFAKNVAIHDKMGYDPCEMVLDPELSWPKARIAMKLISKKLGFRTTIDLIATDTSTIHGSHGRLAEREEDQPIWIGPKTFHPSGALDAAELCASIQKAML